MQQQTPLHIQIFSCGGTIDKVYFDAKSDYEVGEPRIVEIFRRANVAFDYSLESLMRKDSLEMQDADRALVRSRVEACAHRCILITHGTDTMPQTAQALVGLQHKAIVLTGSMTPARFEASDAEFNIGFAAGVLQTLGPGVYIAMNGRVFPADHVKKNREAGRFEWT